MPITTRAAVVTMATELAIYPDGADWTQAIADAEVELGSAAGNLSSSEWEYAGRLLVAHLVTTRKNKSLTSPRIQSENIAGVISRSYAASMASDARSLDQTGYGLQLLELLRRSGAGGLAT